MRIAVLAFALAAMPALAQMPTEPPGKPDASRIVAGRYEVEPGHTQVRFTVMHLGFTPYSGSFSDASGSLTIDPARPGSASVSISVPMASAWTPVAKLTDELRSSMFFDPAKYPTMTFVSDRVTVHGHKATIDGRLTMHGVTRPLRLDASFVGAGTMRGKRTVGFTATGTLKRSEYGVNYGIPLVSDEVKIDIAAAFEQPA
ncbi:YceI family protein [Sphingomonas crusticola]|uniref:YceI family protein n=1 Tax=Sphingomonas crusticola TaxID=1697973 RepID=UPI000E26DF86|nr:YceI family protein [Sphingomonas crusticola]